ncbi:hypothetical protein CH063_10469 [Colletotrichum higginsianum]|uniref:Uncharacterized protein n=1 Tax=Colletotrichum higginsianum (strain IMI 349063) TaxID=759273 RepID=H1VHK0_COLHI|nr:hypothetical protein CH063_10469 [Colletotrichum higginsianum]
MGVRLLSSQRLIYEWGTRHINPDGGQSVTERTLFHFFLLSRLDFLKDSDVDGGGFCLGMDSKRFSPQGACKTPPGGGGPSGSASPGGDLHRSSRLLRFSSLGLCSTMFLGSDDGASDWLDDFFSQLLRGSRDNKVAVSSSHKVGSRHRQGRGILTMLFSIRLALSLNMTLVPQMSQFS